MTRPHRKRLEYIRPAPNPAVNGKRDTTPGDWCAFSQDVDCGRHSVELAPAVVGDEDPVDVVLYCAFDVVGAVYCF